MDARTKAIEALRLFRDAPIVNVPSRVGDDRIVGFRVPAPDDAHECLTGLGDKLAALREALSALEAASAEGWDAPAKLLAKWIGYSWDGLRSDGRISDAGFPQWAWSGNGHKHFQGRQQDLRDLAQAVVSAAPEPPAAPPVEGDAVSPRDPTTILAGIRQFGLAPDGSDLRDLATAIEALEGRMRELEAEVGYSSNGVNVWGNEPSIKAIRQAFHYEARARELEEECRLGMVTIAEERARAEAAESALATERERADTAEAKIVAMSDWTKADYWWEDDDPEVGDGDTPDNLLMNHGEEVVVAVWGNLNLGKRYGFRLPALLDAETDDYRFFWFDDKAAADEALANALKTKEASDAE